MELTNEPVLLRLNIRYAVESPSLTGPDAAPSSKSMPLALVAPEGRPKLRIVDPVAESRTKTPYVPHAQYKYLVLSSNPMSYP
jgi:hypothetical protein